MDVFRERRERLIEAYGPRSVAILASTPVAQRNADVEHPYRQDSDLFYLTGLDEPDTVLVLSNFHEEHRAVLFVRPRDPVRESWDGPRAGVEGAVEVHGVDAAFEAKELTAKLPLYLQNAHTLHVRLGQYTRTDRRVLGALSRVRARHREGVTCPTTLVDHSVHLHEQRLTKDAAELAVMRRAAAITAEAHLAAMQVALPGAHEYQVEAELQRVFRRSGCERAAYPSIVGSGPNAGILHHRRNDRQMHDGELLLIDAGCELEYYASDVTRTFPVNGTFTDAQRAIYDVVLSAQEACIAAVAPGATVDGIHEIAKRRVTEGLVELGLIEGPVEHALEEKLYKPFLPHRTSHWLGMDVHDVGIYYVDGESRPLEPGFVLTIEPGVYIPATAEVDAKWQGIGVRIEDDIVVTEEGHENLTAAIPKKPDELEQILAGR